MNHHPMSHHSLPICAPHAGRPGASMQAVNWQLPLCELYCPRLYDAPLHLCIIPGSQSLSATTDHSAPIALKPSFTAWQTRNQASPRAPPVPTWRISARSRSQRAAAGYRQLNSGSSAAGIASSSTSSLSAVAHSSRTGLPGKYGFCQPFDAHSTIVHLEHPQYPLSSSQRTLKPTFLPLVQQCL